MQLSGTLRSWNDGRGFGFIAPTQGGAEIFVHIAAFPRDGSRPTIGEKLQYELGEGRDGRPQAMKVVRLAVGAVRPPVRSPASSSQRHSSLLGGLLLVVLVVGAGAWGYRHFSAGLHRGSLAAQPALTTSETPAPAAVGTYSCDGRTHCSQMTSCAEATWFINNCPGTKMDGNHDGVPCEQQWCTGPGSR